MLYRNAHIKKPLKRLYGGSNSIASGNDDFHMLRYGECLALGGEDFRHPL